MKNKLEELRKEFNDKIDSLLKKEIKLEDSNFKVDSNGWKKITENGQEVLVNPEGDIWEILGGEFHGEQLFTWDAAMRETKKAGKRIPTDKEFNNITIKEIKKSPASGVRYTSGNYYNRASYLYLWSSSESGSFAWVRYSYYTQSNACRNLNDKAYGSSVRCIKEV